MAAWGLLRARGDAGCALDSRFDLDPKHDANGDLGNGEATVVLDGCTKATLF